MKTLLVGILLTCCTLAQATTLPALPGVRLDEVVANRLQVRIQPWVPRYDHQRVLAEAGLTLHHEILPYELSLTAKAEKSENLLAVDNEADRALALEEPLLRSYVVTYDGHVPPEKMISLLRAGCSDIEVCEVVAVAKLTGEPNDPQIGQQRLLKLLQVFEAWDIEFGDENVLIGISDSGILQTHEDLQDNIAVNSGEIPNNGVDDDGNGFIDDYNGYNFAWQEDGTLPGNTKNDTEGHGTGVAGICGATVNNGIGIAGVAGNCKLWPMKTMPEGSTGIVYGYESIMYCALNNIKVVNCSWGGFSESCINQSIIDYAVARGVAVVAAAGNHGTAAPFFPGAYNGVFNVGVTDPSDRVVSMSGHGPTVDIMAPGQGTRTTYDDGTYGGFCCTSGAAPIVSAVVGLVRSQRPDLGPLEACGIVREMADSIAWFEIPENINERVLPRGRVNALAAVSAPNELVSLNVLGASVSSTSTDSRWGVGDTIDLRITALNVGAAFGFEEFVRNPMIAQTPPATERIGETRSVIIQPVAKADTFTLPAVSAVIRRNTDTTEYAEAIIVARDANDSVQQRIVRVALIPSPPYRDLTNNVLEMSVSDNGRIGKADVAKGQGLGVKYLQWCGQLYEGGLMVGTPTKVVDAIRAVRITNNHFTPIKPFTRPDPLRSIVADAAAPDSLRIGVEVDQRVAIGSGDSAFFVTDVTVTNTSNETISDVVVAWFYDFDLGTSPAHNVVALSGATSKWAEQKLNTLVTGEPIVLVGSVSTYADAVPVSVGLDNTETYGGFSKARKLELLYSGTSSQIADTTDVATINGMRFVSPIAPGQSRSLRHYFVFSDDVPNTGMRDALIEQYVNKTRQEQQTSKNLRIAPNPTSGMISVDVPIDAMSGEVAIFDVLGHQVEGVFESWNTPTSVVPVDVRVIAQGSYFLRVTSQLADGKTTVQTSPFTILR